jgi:hypothetical protein
MSLFFENCNKGKEAKIEMQGYVDKGVAISKKIQELKIQELKIQKLLKEEENFKKQISNKREGKNAEATVNVGMNNLRLTKKDLQDLNEEVQSTEEGLDEEATVQSETGFDEETMAKLIETGGEDTMAKLIEILVSEGPKDRKTTPILNEEENKENPIEESLNFLKGIDFQNFKKNDIYELNVNNKIQVASDSQNLNFFKDINPNQFPYPQNPQNTKQWEQIDAIPGLNFNPDILGLDPKDFIHSVNKQKTSNYNDEETVPIFGLQKKENAVYQGNGIRKGNVAGQKNNIPQMNDVEMAYGTAKKTIDLNTKNTLLNEPKQYTDTPQLSYNEADEKTVLIFGLKDKKDAAHQENESSPNKINEPKQYTDTPQLHNEADEKTVPMFIGLQQKENAVYQGNGIRKRNVAGQKNDIPQMNDVEMAYKTAQKTTDLNIKNTLLNEPKQYTDTPQLSYAHQENASLLNEIKKDDIVITKFELFPKNTNPQIARTDFHNPSGNSQNLSGNSQNSLRNSQNLSGNLQNLSGNLQNPLGNSQNISNNIKSAAENPSQLEEENSPLNKAFIFFISLSVIGAGIVAGIVGVEKMLSSSKLSDIFINKSSESNNNNAVNEDTISAV